MPVETADQESSASLMSGIVEDLQRLLRQEARLARQELKQEWQKIKSAAVSFAVGAAVMIFAILFLLFTFVYLLAYYTPIPTWGCYGIVSAVLALVAAGLLLAGKHKANQIQVPLQETVATLKENAQWIQNQV
jgi:hypothetical protein